MGRRKFHFLWGKMMINRKTLLASGIAAAMFAASSASALPLQSSNAGAAVQPTFTVPNGMTTLYDQADNASGNGAPVQNFEAGYETYDNEAADDFVVPAGGWTVSTLNMVTTQSTGFTGTETADVTFYTDAGGLPSTTAVCSFAGATATVAAASTTIDLTGGCSLGAGSYWVAVMVNQDFATNGQIFWSNRTVQSNNTGVWRNPGDGFGTGCTNWATTASCDSGGGPVGGGFPDFQFQLIGAVGGGGIPLEPARELPTLSQWSALLAASGLALIGMLGLRRRSRR
jgi:hypothetical protein